MIKEILSRHREGNLAGGVPNPSVSVMCQLVGKAALAVTPSVQRRSFRNTGVTLNVDGSEDDELSPNLKKLFLDHNQDMQLRPEDIARFRSQPSNKPSVAKIFKGLCFAGKKLKTEEFFHKPVAAARLKKRPPRLEYPK